jgi:hypothetical protein
VNEIDLHVRVTRARVHAAKMAARRKFFGGFFRKIEDLAREARQKKIGFVAFLITFPR